MRLARHEATGQRFQAVLEGVAHGALHHPEMQEHANVTSDGSELSDSVFEGVYQQELKIPLAVFPFHSCDTVILCALCSIAAP